MSVTLTSQSPRWFLTLITRCRGFLRRRIVGIGMSDAPEQFRTNYSGIQ